MQVLAELDILKKTIEKFIAEKDNLSDEEARKRATDLLTQLNNLIGELQKKVEKIANTPIAQAIDQLKKLKAILASYQTTPQEIAVYLKGPLPETPAEIQIRIESEIAEKDRVLKALIRHKGEDKRVAVDKSVDLNQLKCGDIVYVLGDQSICLMGKAIEAMLSKVQVGYVVEIFEKAKTVAVSTGEGEDKKVACRFANWIKKDEIELLSRVLVDTTNEIIIELLPPDPEIQKQFEIRNLPDITFDDIGGLDKEIGKIKTLFTDVFLYADLYDTAKLTLAKSLLLHGPSGCGKTLIAKALISELIKTIQKAYSNQKIVGYYLITDAASFLQKYVGVGEAMIEKMWIEAAKFQKEGEKIGERRIFLNIIDEMDAAFKARGAGISTDANESLVLKLCAKLDGFEGFKDIVVVGMTNRADRLDGALMRRFIKIRVPFPTEEGVKDIFRKHLRGLIIKQNIPINEKYLVDRYPLHHKDVVSQKDITNLDDKGQPMFAEFNRDLEKIVGYFVEQIAKHINDPQPKTLPDRTTRPPFPLKGKLSGSDIESILTDARFVMVQEAKDKRKEGKTDFKMTLRLGHIHDAIDEFAEMVKSAEKDSQENFFNPLGRIGR